MLRILGILSNQQAGGRLAPPMRAHVSGGETQGRLLVAASAVAATTAAALEPGPGGRWGLVWSPRPPELPLPPPRHSQVLLEWRECFPSDGPICDAVAVSAAASERTR